MKKNLIRLTTIGAVAALAIVATGAFFSDTETSTGNTFVAGAIDLKVDNTSYVTDVDGTLISSPNTSWELTDLKDHLFFNFHDLKPGDIGEDTISLHVDNNEAWMCAAARITDDSDVSYTEPESDDDTTIGDPLITDGELAEQLNFAFWADDGDNVFEAEERIFLEGPISGIGEAGQITLADSQTNIWGGQGPFPGGQTKYIGKAWCFGELTQAPVAPGEGGPLSGGAQARGTGFTCNGESVNNAAQTDQVKGDLQFYAVQSRNNKGFTCAHDYTPKWPQVSEEKIGALLSAYVQPTDTCTTTVTDITGDGEIQTAINAASDGAVICVDDGVYNENVNINKPLTLAGAGASATSVINGQGGNQTGAVMINANNVTVKGFEINGHSSGTATVFVNAAVSSIVLDSNKLNIPSPDGFLTVGGVSNITVNNNEFIGASGALRLLYVNGLASVNVSSDNVDLTNNTFGGTLTGTLAIGHEASNSLVTQNVFDSSPSYAVFEAWMDSIALHENNFNGVGGLKVAQMENGQTGAQGFVNAENNWWGAAAPAGHIANDVDDDPKAAVAFPEN